MFLLGFVDALGIFVKLFSLGTGDPANDNIVTVAIAYDPSNPSGNWGQYLFNFLSLAPYNDPIPNFVALPRENVDLTPKGIIERFDLFRPIYSSTTNYGHFGKNYLPWENTDLFG